MRDLSDDEWITLALMPMIDHECSYKTAAITLEKYRNAEHCGDCTKQCCTCMRCVVEEAIEAAALMRQGYDNICEQAKADRSNVADFIGATKADLNPTVILSEALKQEFDSVIVIGKTGEDDFYFASSSGEEAHMVHMLERVKHDILSGVYG